MLFGYNVDGRYCICCKKDCRMNVVYIHTHDSGRCVQNYGYPVETPNILSLAKNSLQFNKAFSAAPTCSPSRAALLTGLMPHSNGMLGLAHRGFELNDYSGHMSAWLRNHGYETVLCGVQHEASDVAKLAYDRVINNGERNMMAYDLKNCDSAVAFISETHDKPFFLSYGMLNTHRPFPEKCTEPNYVMPFPGIPDLPETRRDVGAFYNSVRFVDKCVGRVVDAVNNVGIADDTIIIFTTDHGPAFPGMKCTLYDGGIGVVLLIHLPHGKRNGEVCDQLISQLDVFPTLCDLLNIDKPDRLHGVSFKKLLSEECAVRTSIYAEVNFHAAYEPLRCIRTDRYKLIRRFDKEPGVIQANIDTSPTKEQLRKIGWMNREIKNTELYDLLYDPQEKNNLFGKPEANEIYKELSKRLNRQMEETDDPLLENNGVVPRPKGTRINKRETTEPGDTLFETDE